jgi:hypothetical protein
MRHVEPGRGVRLALGHGQGRGKEGGEFVLLPGLAASVASSPTVTMAISARRARRLVPKTRPYLRIGT